MTIVNYLHNLDNDIECQLCCTLFNENNYDECKDCHYKICNICYDNYINKYNYKNCPQCRMIIHQENNAVVDTNMDESLNINELPICDRFRCIFFTQNTVQFESFEIYRFCFHRKFHETRNFEISKI